MRRFPIKNRLLKVLLPILSLGFSAPLQAGSDGHGKITTLSAAPSKNYERCAHKVPKEVCTQCNPHLVSKFKAAKDWCGEHGVPESQCFKCHPDLTFEPLPALAALSLVRSSSKTTMGLSARVPVYRHIVSGDEKPGTFSSPLMVGLFVGRTLSLY